MTNDFWRYYFIFKKNGKWWLDNGHYYLQEYNVLEIIVLIFLLFLFHFQFNFLADNYEKMSEWHMAAFAQFPLATWAMLTSVWKSINTELTIPKIMKEKGNGDSNEQN